MQPIEQKAQGSELKKRGKIPYWMKNVESTPELVLRYQVRPKKLEEALQADLRVLKEINQVRNHCTCTEFSNKKY